MKNLINSNILSARKELVTLTKNHNRAIILNQLLIWTKTLEDFEFLVLEEKAQASSHLFGWLRKTPQEIKQETQMYVSSVTLRKYLSTLVRDGWVSERFNPDYKWDRTIQYRVNLRALWADLQAKGWRFSQFPDDLFPSNGEKQ